MRHVAFALLVAFSAPQAPEGVDPSLRAAVERFYAMQEAEDVAGYLSLWSTTAERPRPEQLKYIFDSGDDKFTDITITAVRPQGSIIVVRVSATRDRTATMRRPDGSPIVSHTAVNAALTYTKEGGEWKLLREGTPVDALADAVIAAPDAETREKLLSDEPVLVGPLLVSAISRQAASAAQKGMYPRAQALYERAFDIATRIGDKKLQADTLQNIGNALYYQRNFVAAKPIYEQFVAIERELGNDEGIATALVGLGTAQYSQFEYTDALVTFHEALGIQERLSDNSAIPTTLISTGNIQYVEGDFNGAIVDYRRARSLYRAASDTRGEARALDGLGRSFTAQGDLAAALDAFNGVLEEGRSRNDPGLQGGALLSLGDVHVRLGNIDIARGLFDQSRTQFERLGDLPNVGHAWQAIAKTNLLVGRFAAAEDEFGRSMAACTKGADAECTAHATVGGAFAQSLQQHYPQAVTSYRKAIALFTTQKKREDAARAEIGLSQALTGSGDYGGALSVARHAQSEGSAIGQEDVVWRALLAEARADRRLSNSPAALTAAKDAVSHVERMAERAFDGVGDQPSPDSAGAYALLAVLQSDMNDAAAAFTTIERRNAHSLRIALERNERDISRGMTPAEREEERQLAAEVATVRAQIDHERALPKPDAARIDRLQQRLAAAVEKRSAQRQAVFARLPDLRTWRGLEPPITMDAAAKGLLDGEALVEFVIDDEDLLAVALTPGTDRPDCRAYLAPVPRQTLAEQIAHAVEPTALRDVTAWHQGSADLMKTIPAGAWSIISGAAKVVLVPDDVLWRVPFEALPVGEGVLADRTSVLYAGSATSIFHLPPVTEAVAAVPLIAVVAPEVSTSVRDRLQATAPGWTLRQAEAADAEVQAVAALFEDPPATILSQSSATESAVRAQAGSAAILHVAAPFRMNGASPLFSSILLTPDSSVTEVASDTDGVLELREIINLELHGRLAVFSDGGTAAMRGAASAADIVRWAWRAAGVPAIVLPRWTADDRASLAFLRIVYARLKAGDTPQVALQAAGTRIREAEETRAPYYWAAWEVVGR